MLLSTVLLGLLLQPVQEALIETVRIRLVFDLVLDEWLSVSGPVHVVSADFNLIKRQLFKVYLVATERLLIHVGFSLEDCLERALVRELDVTVAQLDLTFLLPLVAFIKPIFESTLRLHTRLLRHQHYLIFAGRMVRFEYELFSGLLSSCRCRELLRCPQENAVNAFLDPR